MRLHSLMLAAALALAPLAGGAQPDAPSEIGETPDRQEVRTALDEVATDPNLATQRKVNMLRWKKSERTTEESNSANAIVRWLRGLFGWAAESARLLVWVVGGLAAALLVYYIARVARTRGLPTVPKAFDTTPRSRKVL